MALALSALLPWAITPLLMLGGAYLCFEGAEKVWHALAHREESLAEVAAELNSESHEREMVAGAIRTDFILSAEIMAIALAEVATEPFAMRAAILALVAVAITVGVYGVVGLIVKMDDVGLHLAERRNPASRALGRGAGPCHAEGDGRAVGDRHRRDDLGRRRHHRPRAGGVRPRRAGACHPRSGGGGGSCRARAAGVVEWTVGAAGSGLFGLAVGALVVLVTAARAAHGRRSEAAA